MMILQQEIYLYHQYSSKINFTRKLEEDDGVAMFFVTEKQQRTILNFSLDSLIVTE